MAGEELAHTGLLRGRHVIVVRTHGSPPEHAVAAVHQALRHMVLAHVQASPPFGGDDEDVLAAQVHGHTVA